MNTAAASQETDLFPESEFLQAWKEGVMTAGPSLFGCQARTPMDATHWTALTPKLDVMRKAIANRSQAQAYLIAVMASFFNDAEGQKLLTKAGLTFGGGARVVSPKERDIIARLFTHYRGW